MGSKRSDLWAGFFVLFMVFAFLLFLSWAGGGLERAFLEKKEAITWFKQIGGLKKNSQVVFQGFLIGEVTDIDYEKRVEGNSKAGLIRVTMMLDESFDLPPQGISMITTASLLGDPYIEITTLYNHDRSIEKMLVLGDKTIHDKDGKYYLDAIDPQSFGMLQVKLAQMMDGIDVHIDNLSDSLGRVLTSADMLIGDPKFRSDIHQTAANLNAATGELPATISQARAMMASGASAMGRIDGLIARSEDTIASIMTNVDEMSVNTRILTYGLTQKPSMLVWGDKAWEARVARRDPELLNASFRTPLSSTTEASTATSTPVTGTRPPKGRTSFF